jgi:DGQHR domain-containing protein
MLTANPVTYWFLGGILSFSPARSTSRGIRGDQLTRIFGRELEELGSDQLKLLGLRCFGNLQQVRLKDLEPAGSYSTGDHAEIDLVVVHDDAVFVGEITDDAPRELRSKHKRFRGVVDLIRRVHQQNLNTWSILGIPDNELRAFRSVKTVKGFFITTRATKFDVELDEFRDVATFYKNDWQLLQDYAVTIGSFGKNEFLHRFALPKQEVSNILQRPVLKTEHAHILAGEPAAELCTFQANPYHILEVAAVYRRDQLPDLSPNPRYQRPLIPSKLAKIRTDLLLPDPDFVFPNPILVILDPQCEIVAHESTFDLRIPRKYGALAVIDGQHRLFSYASDSVRERAGETARILVTAVRFDSVDEAKTFKLSAKAFVEINSNQTKVSQTHIDAIAYEILGKTDARSLAAEVLLRVNQKRNSALFHFFQSSLMIRGVIPSTTVLAALRRLTDRAAIKDLAVAKTKIQAKRAKGYKQLLGKSVLQLHDAETLVSETDHAITRYFNELRSVFRDDWMVVRESPSPTSFALSKFVAAWIRLFNTFLREGLDWRSIRDELEVMKKNVAIVTGRNSGVLFEQSDARTPSAHHSEGDAYTFLDRNRLDPVPMRAIDKERRNRQRRKAASGR